MGILLQYVSDFHLEARRKWPFIPAKAPVLLLAGDIGTPKKDTMLEFFKDVSARFQRVIYVAGNHEYFGNIMETVDTAIRSIVNQFPNVTFLQNQDTIITDVYDRPVRVIGSTLWAPCPQEVHDLRDFRKIFLDDPPRRLRASDMRVMYEENVRYLERALEHHRNVDTVILTHHGPVLEANGPFMGHPASLAYASDLRRLMHPQVKAWVYGHTHQNMTLRFGSCIVTTNALGYPGEKVSHFRTVALLHI